MDGKNSRLALDANSNTNTLISGGKGGENDLINDWMEYHSGITLNTNTDTNTLISGEKNEK